MKDLTAGGDRNDNVRADTQLAKTPNYIWHLAVCPLNFSCSVRQKQWNRGITIFMDLVSHIKYALRADICVWGTQITLKNRTDLTLSCFL